MTDIPLAIVAAVAPSQHGDVVVIIHQAAYTGKGHLIFSPAQLECYNNDVNDKSTNTPGGLQCIKTIDKYLHPLNIETGLPYVPLHSLSGDDWTTKPHVIWDPKQLDNTISNKDDWYVDMDTPKEGRDVPPFDEQGKYYHRYEVQFANLPY